MVQTLLQVVQPQSKAGEGSSIMPNSVESAQKYLLKGLWDGSDIVINPMDAIVSTRFFRIEREESPQNSEQRSVTHDLADKVVVGSTAVVTTSLSVGYVIWILRGGSLLTAFMSAMPAWQAFDPLPVLQSFERQNEEEEDDSLLSIATQKAAKAIKKVAGDRAGR